MQYTMQGERLTHLSLSWRHIKGLIAAIAILVALTIFIPFGSTAYAATNRELEPNDTVQTATAVVVNSQYVGNLSDICDVDFYKFTLTALGSVTLKLQFVPDGGYNVCLFGYDASGSTNDIQYTLMSGSNMLSSITQYGEKVCLPAGTYYISISEYSNSYHDFYMNSDYTLTVQLDLPATAAPKITKQPKSAVYYVKQTATPLTVTAASQDKGSIKYQWYSNTKNSTSGAKAISGATKASYTPPTTKAGALYYFCKVKNTNTATSPGTKTVNSTIVYVRTAPDFNKKVVTVAPDAKTGLRIDVPGQAKTAGIQVGLWANNSGANQRYYLTRTADGYYRLKCVDSGLYLTVKGGTAKEGAAIVQAKSSTSKAQKFKIKYVSSGKYLLISALNSGYVIATKGTSPASGAKIVLEKRNAASKTQVFRLNVVKPAIASGSVVTIKNVSTGGYMQVSKSSTANNAALVLNKRQLVPSQQFKLVYVASTGYYRVIPQNSGLPLSVSATKTFANGAKVFQIMSGTTLNQQWDIKKNSDGTYTFYQPNSRLVLDAKGASKAQGTSVIIWPLTGGTNQKWVLTKG